MSMRIKMKAVDKALSTCILASLRDQGYSCTFNQLINNYQPNLGEEDVLFELCFITSVSYFQGPRHSEEEIKNSLFGKERDVKVDGLAEENLISVLTLFDEVKLLDSSSVVSEFSFVEGCDHVVSAAILASNLRQVGFVKKPGYEGDHWLNSEPIPSRGTILVPGDYNLTWFEVRFDGFNYHVYRSRHVIRVVANSWSNVSGTVNVTDFDVAIMTLEEPIICLAPDEIDASEYGEKSRVMNGLAKSSDEILR